MEGSAPALAPKSRRPLRWLLSCAFGLVLLVLSLEAGRIFIGLNVHAVLPGKVYRSAQPSRQQLQWLINRYGIRTVVNLRGFGSPFPWYIEEARVTQEHGVAQEDICFSAGRLPSVSEMRRLIEVLEHADYPLLFHCRRGSDRTGLAAAIALLWHEEIELDDACRQLGLRYGHVALGRPANLDAFFDLYRDWLAERSCRHARARFRHWLSEEYGGGKYRVKFDWLAPVPASVPVGRPTALHVRALNTSVGDWRFRPGKYAGIHIGVHVWDEQNRHIHVERSGLRDARVPPGEAIDLTVVVPALEKPGRYRLMVDLIDEQHGWFYQIGSEPLETELVVRE